MNDPLFTALFEILRLENLLASFAGVTFGLFIGMMPGLTVSLGMVLLLPLTYKISAITSVCLLLGLYASGMTGGSFSAVLINIPGTPSASATALDGHAMAKQGRAGEALGISVIASFIGGIFGLACLWVAAPVIARVALNFGAPELFAIVLLGLTLICSFGQESNIKGLISGIVGLIIMTVGLDPMMGTPRYTFDTVDLQAGISFLPAMIGLFAIPQIIKGLSGKSSVIPQYDEHVTGVLPKLRNLVKLTKAMLIGSVIGTGVGAIPGTGGPIGVFLAYDYARKASPAGPRFGTGEPEGVAAPEAANNAVAGGALIPMLTLGIPGDPITAILLGALLIHGLIPGPLLFTQNAHFVYAVFWAYLVANLMNLVVCLSTIKLWVRVLKVPERILIPIIVVVCIVGTYGLRNTFFDTGIMLVFGVMAFFMSKYGFPVVPMLLAIVLGPNLESNLRMSLILADGDWTIFFTQPISLGFIILAVVTFFTPLLLPAIRSRLKKKTCEEQAP
jgi:putative tricarboxylic transport membrane protein